MITYIVLFIVYIGLGFLIAHNIEGIWCLWSKEKFEIIKIIIFVSLFFHVFSPGASHA